MDDGAFHSSSLLSFTILELDQRNLKPTCIGMRSLRTHKKVESSDCKKEKPSTHSGSERTFEDLNGSWTADLVEFSLTETLQAFSEGFHAQQQLKRFLKGTLDVSWNSLAHWNLVRPSQVTSKAYSNYA